jgi:hypothetical protein
MLYLPGVVAFARRRWRLSCDAATTDCESCRIYRVWARAFITLSPTSQTAATFPSPTRHGARERTVHQERYNLLKVGYQPQDPGAKVRQDFGVRSVTWLG